MNLVDKITKKQLNPNVPDFRVGDTVNVGVRITEGKRTRIQNFEGLVMARKGAGISETFTVRKMSGGVGVERIFPVHSPSIETMTVIKKGMVRRGKLNFVRNLKGVFKAKERK